MPAPAVQPRGRVVNDSRPSFPPSTIENPNAIDPLHKVVPCTYQECVGDRLTPPPLTAPNPQVRHLIEVTPFVPMPGSLLERYDAILAFDEEWAPRGERNDILSYQWSVIARRDGDWVYTEDIHYPEPGQRLSSARLIGLALGSLGIGYKRAGGMRVILVGHYAFSDMCGLSDRTTFMKRLCKQIRKTLVTMGVDRNWRADFGGRHYAKVKVRVLDTWLLAPQGQQSLENISKVLTHEKIKIDGAWKSKMDVLLAEDPELFAAYAQEDTRATLEYFVRTLDTLKEKVGITKIPMTLGGASADAFISTAGGGRSATFKRVFGKQEEVVVTKKGRFTKIEKGEDRRVSETLAADSYHGGLNTVFRIGHYDCSPDELVLDIDFAGVYSAALGSITAVDWSMQAAQIHNAETLQAYFTETALSEAGGVPNILGLIQFEFPTDELYPCLPLRSEGGLLYPLKGTTYATGIEMDLALRLGAKLRFSDVRSFPAQRGEDQRVVLPFAEFIGRLNQARSATAKGSLENMLYKELANSLYGKLAQGIKSQTTRAFYADEDGSLTKDFLPECAVTCPHYAAACTGIIRAALSAIVSGLSACAGFAVLSATTDGCMLIVPKRFDPETLTQSNGKLETSGLDLLALYPEVKALERYPAIRALIMGRRNMGMNNTWIEVKHVGDAASTMKTRVNTMSYRGVTQHEAKTGIRLHDGETLDALHARPDIPIMEYDSLPSPRDLMTGAVKDFVAVKVTKRINTDYDYKRLLNEDGCTTRPFRDKGEFHKVRQTVANTRKERSVRGMKIPGKRATPERIYMLTRGIRLKPGEVLDDGYRRYVLTFPIPDFSEDWRRFLHDTL
jgi:hypothetical protein